MKKAPQQKLGKFLDHTIATFNINESIIGILEGENPKRKEVVDNAEIHAKHGPVNIGEMCGTAWEKSSNGPKGHTVTKWNMVNRV